MILCRRADPWRWHFCAVCYNFVLYIFGGFLLIICLNVTVQVSWKLCIVIASINYFCTGFASNLKLSYFIIQLACCSAEGPGKDFQKKTDFRTQMAITQKQKEILCLGGFLICGYQKFCSLPPKKDFWPKICIFGHFEPNFSISGKFGPMPKQETSCIVGFSVMWVPKLMLPLVKIRTFVKKRPNLAQNMHFWPFWAKY